MEQIPDAPWIRDAERNGYPEAKRVHCPVCGSECQVIYIAPSGDVVGCEWCVVMKDADVWDEEREGGMNND